MEPPGDIRTDTSCNKNQLTLNIHWDRPSTLLGVDILSYSVTIEEVNNGTNGSDNSVAVPFPGINSTSCGTHSICVAASTPAGWSNYSCIDVMLLKGLLESKVPSLLLKQMRINAH